MREIWINLRRQYITASAGNATLRYTVAVIFLTELYHNFKMEDQYASFEHNYEGWNFNSGNYLFTTDTK